MEYQLIPMEEKHLLTLAALERICFSDPWSENAFRAEMDNPGARFTVAQDGAGTVLGYLGLHYVLDEGYIANIAVDPLFRRQGIGSALLDDAADFGPSGRPCLLTLEVRQSNLGAQRCTAGTGFALPECGKIITGTLWRTLF